MKTVELAGYALDWAVAKCEGKDMGNSEDGFPFNDWLAYSIDWSQGGPIIERELIHVTHSHSRGNWKAYVANHGLDYFGSTPLIAAMRCYVANKLGHEFEIPKDLTQ